MSFAINKIGLGHASRLVAVHDELQREGFLGSTFFVEHEMQLITDYGFNQVVLPWYPDRWSALGTPDWYPRRKVELGHSGEPIGLEAGLARAVVESALRWRRPIVLHDIFIHHTLYALAASRRWPQGVLFRPPRKNDRPALAWLRKAAPGVSVVFWIGRAGYERIEPGLSVFGVDELVRRPLGDRSLWDGESGDELRIVVAAGGGGRPDSEPFLNAAVAAVDIVGRRSGRSIDAQIVTGPFYGGGLRLPSSSAAQITVRRYVPPTYSLYSGAAIVVAQAGYNTFHELGQSGVPHVLVPGPAYAVSDDQRFRAQARAGEPGVYIADCDPEDIANGITVVSQVHPVGENRLLAASKPIVADSGKGAWQVAALLEVMAGA